MDAILVTFQEHVVARGAAIRKLRETQGRIGDSEHYKMLMASADNAATASPWEFFFAAVSRAALAQDRMGVIKQLNEAERVLLSIAQVRHQIKTGAKVNDRDVRGAYLQAVESYIQNEARAARRAAQASPPAAPVLRPEQQTQTRSEPNLARYASALARTPSMQPGMASVRSSGKKLWGSGLAGIAKIAERVRLALSERRVGLELAAGGLALFVGAAYFIAPLFQDSQPAHDVTTARTVAAAAPKATHDVPVPPPANTSPKAGSSFTRLVHGVNVHANPGPGGIVSTLPRGLKVEVVETRGQWVLVKTDNANGKGQPLTGWVFNTFLETESAPLSQTREAENN